MSAMPGFLQWGTAQRNHSEWKKPSLGGTHYWKEEATNDLLKYRLPEGLLRRERRRGHREARARQGGEVGLLRQGRWQPVQGHVVPLQVGIPAVQGPQGVQNGVRQRDEEVQGEVHGEVICH